MSEDYTYYSPPLHVAVTETELAFLRGDLKRAVAALRQVLDGMTCQELAALADLVDELEERYGVTEATP